MDYGLLKKKIQKKCPGLDGFMRQHSACWIYGCGLVGRTFADYLSVFGYEVKGFIESDNYCCGEKSILGLPLKRASDILQADSDIGVIIAVRKDSVEKVFSVCVAYGVHEESILIQHIIEPGFDRFNMKACFIGNKPEPADGFFGMYNTLDEMGRKNGTDKAYEYNHYLNKYEFFLQRDRESIETVIELGVYMGASLSMWEEYFPNARIIGVDFDSRCEKYSFGRKEVMIKDLSKEDSLLYLTQYAPDIVIDDASHRWSHQIMAFSILFPKLSNGGIYILEDIATSFDMFDGVGWYQDACISPYDFMSCVMEVVSSNEELRISTSIPSAILLKNEIEELAKMIEMISVIRGSIIVIKK